MKWSSTCLHDIIKWKILSNVTAHYNCFSPWIPTSYAVLEEPLNSLLSYKGMYDEGNYSDRIRESWGWMMQGLSLPLRYMLPYVQMDCFYLYIFFTIQLLYCLTWCYVEWDCQYTLSFGSIFFVERQHILGEKREIFVMPYTALFVSWESDQWCTQKWCKVGIDKEDLGLVFWLNLLLYSMNHVNHESSGNI